MWCRHVVVVVVVVANIYAHIKVRAAKMQMLLFYLIEPKFGKDVPQNE